MQVLESTAVVMRYELGAMHSIFKVTGADIKLGPYG